MKKATVWFTFCISENCRFFFFLILFFFLQLPEDFFAVLINHPYQKINTPLKFHILLHKLLPSLFWSELILHSLPDWLRNWPLTTFMMLGIFLVKALIRYIKSKKIRKGHSFSRNSGSKCPFGFSHIFCKQHTVSTDTVFGNISTGQTFFNS